MNARTIEDLEAIESSAETTELIRRTKEIAKTGIFRMTGEKWKKTMSLRNERRVIDERLQ